VSDLADLKYVVVLSHGLEIPILFPQLLEHCTIVNAMTTVVSAGFCRIINSGGQLTVMTFGDSHTLGRRSRLEDNEIIRRHLLSQ